MDDAQGQTAPTTPLCPASRATTDPISPRFYCLLTVDEIDSSIPNSHFLIFLHFQLPITVH
jgi:hypothetical protein